MILNGRFYSPEHVRMEQQSNSGEQHEYYRKFMFESNLNVSTYEIPENMTVVLKSLNLYDKY